MVIVIAWYSTYVVEPVVQVLTFQNTALNIYIIKLTNHIISVSHFGGKESSEWRAAAISGTLTNQNSALHVNILY